MRRWLIIKNKLIYYDDHVVMPIQRKNGDIYNVLLSYESIEKIKQHNYRWFIVCTRKNKCYYVQSTVYKGLVDGKYKYEGVRLHRFLTEAKDGEYVDHINHNTMDNRLENLRITTNEENLKNRKTKNSNNTTGYRNVTYNKTTGKYIVQLQIDGKNTRLEEFDDVHEAGKLAEVYRNIYYT